MPNEEYARFLARYIESAAYHEAGHITVAAVQQMPLRERGMHIDSDGSGISYYWDRLPGDSSNTPQDIFERENTIVAIYAGWIAQTTYFPDCPRDDWQRDKVKANALLREMHINDALAQRATHDRLRQRAEALTKQHWPVIQALAQAVLAKPYTDQPQSEIQENWSHGRSSKEKWLSGRELVIFFRHFQILAFIRSEDAGKYVPPM